MKKRLFFYLGFLLFMGLMWLNLTQVQISETSNTSTISMFELEMIPMMAMAECCMGEDCSSATNCDYQGWDTLTYEEDTWCCYDYIRYATGNKKI